jgi:hypothetical protein
MTEPTKPAPQEPVTPSRRDRLRPLELIGFAAVLAVFAGLVVLLVLRDPATGLPNFAMAGIAAGIAFIAAVLVVALLGLGGKPSREDMEARKDLRKPDGGKDRWH